LARLAARLALLEGLRVPATRTALIRGVSFPGCSVDPILGSARERRKGRFADRGRCLPVYVTVFLVIEKIKSEMR
jgi:hypothetical protein